MKPLFLLSFILILSLIFISRVGAVGTYDKEYYVSKIAEKVINQWLPNQSLINPITPFIIEDWESGAIDTWNKQALNSSLIINTPKIMNISDNPLYVNILSSYFFRYGYSKCDKSMLELGDRKKC